MAQSLALSALANLRSESAAKMHALQQEAERLGSNIRTLDAAIKLLDPEFKLTKLRAKRTRRKNVFFAQHGEASRFVLGALRESGTLSTTEITDLAISHNGLNRASIDVNALKACILTTLSRQRIKSVVLEVGRDETGTIKWKLAS